MSITLQSKGKFCDAQEENIFDNDNANISAAKILRDAKAMCPLHIGFPHKY